MSESTIVKNNARFIASFKSNKNKLRENFSIYLLFMTIAITGLITIRFENESKKLCNPRFSFLS